MPKALFDTHKPILEKALDAIEKRYFWAHYSEMPSRSAYGETAAEEGKKAFDALLNQRFEIDQVGITGWGGAEESPYGQGLGVSYPISDHEALIEASTQAMKAWQAIGYEARTAICIEILERLNQKSFEIGHAVMMTSGQGSMMAFQAGGSHAQERGLEAVAYAYREQDFIPKETLWVKPQGKHPSLVMKKHYEIVGRGITLVLGCSTFPTWNSYSGLFASLTTGNGVILKPHPNAILPVAMTIRVIQEVLSEYNLDPHLVALSIEEDHEKIRALATHSKIKSIDYTGNNAFGNWLIENATQAHVYAELAGVNHVIIESTDQYKAMLRNLAFTLSLYSGQMCTTTQAIIIPETGIDTDEGHKTFDEVASDLSAAVSKFLSKPEVAFAVLGAIGSEATVARIESANSGKWGEVILRSEALTHPEFEGARVYSPVMLKVTDENQYYAEEQFGPISFVISTRTIETGIELSKTLTREKGALTVGLYSTKESIIEAVIEATLESQVALSINLTEGVFVNQSSAYSDYHGTGGNPAANASYADSAFVANRFRVIQRRYHTQEAV